MTAGVCKLCNGPINPGEPIIVQSGGGWAHYFKSTCDWHKGQEVAFLKACGIDSSDVNTTKQEV